MRISIRQTGQNWTVVESSLYKNEEELQTLLEEAPELIPMAQLRASTGEVRVVVREFNIPGAGSLDLLGFTAAGDIVLMECKLRSNSEIKREVVGQLFEYAGFLWQMTYEELDVAVQQRKGKGLLHLMSTAVQKKDWDPVTFQQTVEHNLSTGGFALTIVVDRATDELQRAATFLNDCGKANYSFHVLEMRRFQTGETEILTPLVHGTVAAVSGHRKNRLTKEQFLEQLHANASDQAKTAEQLYAFAEEEADNLGSGRDSFSFRVVNSAGKGTTIFLVYTAGRMEVGVEAIRQRAGESVAQRFVQRLRDLPGFSNVGPNAKYPQVVLHQSVGNDEAMATFKAAVLEAKAALASPAANGELALPEGE